MLIDRGEPAEALALLQRLPETEAGRALAAEARLLEAGVDVSAHGPRGDRGQARRAARPGARRRRRPPGVRGPPRGHGRRRPAHQGVPAGAGRAPVLMAAPATGTPTTDDDHDTAARRRHRRRPRRPARSTSAAAATTSPTGRSSWGSSTAPPTRSTTRAPPSSSTSSTGGPSSWWPTGRTSSISVGSRPGPGPEVTEAEELDRVVPVVAGLVARFDTPVSVDTWRASVARASYAEGAVMGNDISGLADPDYAPAAAEHGAAVVITHIRLAPRVADPDPHYDDVVHDVARFLDRARRRRPCRRHPRRADRARCRPRPRQDRRAVADPAARLADAWPALGYPLLLSASNKTFLGKILDLELTERREASIGAAALGIAWGCRIVRVHDVKGTCRARDVLAAVSEARVSAARSRPAYLVKGDDAVAGGPGGARAPRRRGGRRRPRARRRGDRRRRRATS